MKECCEFPGKLSYQLINIINGAMEAKRYMEVKLEGREEKFKQLERLQEIPDEIIDLIREADEIVDDIGSEVIKKRWRTYVLGNFFAEEFGYLGKSGGDYMIETIEDIAKEIS